MVRNRRHHGNTSCFCWCKEFQNAWIPWKFRFTKSSRWMEDDVPSRCLGDFWVNQPVDFPRAVTYISDQRSSRAPRSDFHLHNSLWWKLPIYRSSKRPRKFIWKTKRITHPKINHEIFPSALLNLCFFGYLACNVQQNILRSQEPEVKAWVNHARISKKSAFGISKKRKGMTIISCLNLFNQQYHWFIDTLQKNDHISHLKENHPL